MKVVVAHNAYQQRGGEDAVAEAETSLLKRFGHEVISYTRHNDELLPMGRLHAAAGTLWSRRTRRELAVLLRQQRPDVLHVHNTFPLISPSLYWAAADAGVPVVQTLHNFRLMCPQAMLLRDGQVCESCVGKLPLAGVVHACYRGSRTQTAVLASMLVVHRAVGTWQHKVHRYIALNEFCRAKFVQGGLPAKRVVVKPNFVDLAAPVRNAGRSGLLFVGRLSHEKGIAALAEAAATLPPRSLRVAGTGPQADQLQGLPAVQMLGALPPDEVAREMAQAAALVMPSLWYENFPRTLVEAYACGLPVLASRIGALSSLVENGVTGRHFEPGSAADLAAAMQWALSHPQQLQHMGLAARALYEREYTGPVNHAHLMSIYQAAMAEAA